MIQRASVVVPVYNTGATLPETLASLRGEPCDVVVVDDGSTDQFTIEVLARAEADGVRVLRQENQGVSAARMTGVAATTAPYVFHLDSDDVLAPGAIDALADALDRNLQAKLAWGYLGDVDSDEVTKQAPRLDPWLITYMNQMPIMALVRREALLEAGGWRSEPLFEDWDLWCAFAERGWDGIRIPRVVAYYRRTATGRTAMSRGRYDEAVAQLRTDHPELFARRRENLRRSAAPLRLKLALPLLDRMPLTPRMKRALGELIRRPVFTVRQAVRARR